MRRSSAHDGISPQASIPAVSPPVEESGRMTRTGWLGAMLYRGFISGRPSISSSRSISSGWISVKRPHIIGWSLFPNRFQFSPPALCRIKVFPASEPIGWYAQNPQGASMANEPIGWYAQASRRKHGEWTHRVARSSLKARAWRMNPSGGMPKPQGAGMANGHSPIGWVIKPICRSPALKGRQNKAQGKAQRSPGFRPPWMSSPERATEINPTGNHIPNTHPNC